MAVLTASSRRRRLQYGKRLPTRVGCATTRAVTRPTPRAPTLHDVAREAGVAVSTASRALTLPARFSATTRAQVQEVVRRLASRPNLIARVLPAVRTAM